MNSKYIICNLKANKTLAEILEYKKVIDEIEIKNNELVICPPVLYAYLFNDNKYNLGIQDVSRFLGGAFTGEISAKQLSSLDVKYVLVGHYERRKYFKEDSSILIKKINNCLEEGIKPIYFIGEPEEYLSDDYLINQIKDVFDGIDFCKLKNIIVAYEPAQNIGTETILDVDIISNKISFIKDYIKKSYDEVIPVIYGGSVTDQNVGELITINDLDGILLGHSSLNPYTVSKIYSKF